MAFKNLSVVVSLLRRWGEVSVQRSTHGKHITSQHNQLDELTVNIDEAGLLSFSASAMRGVRTGSGVSLAQVAHR